MRLLFQIVTFLISARRCCLAFLLHFHRCLHIPHCKITLIKLNNESIRPFLWCKQWKFSLSAGRYWFAAGRSWFQAGRSRFAAGQSRFVALALFTIGLVQLWYLITLVWLPYPNNYMVTVQQIVLHLVDICSLVKNRESGFLAGRSRFAAGRISI